MAKKNMMDDGSYQKSQKLGDSKGRFVKKEELDPPIKVNVGVYGKKQTHEKVDRYIQDVEDETIPLSRFSKLKLGYMPLDAEGKPVFGMVPFQGDAADMLSRKNKRAALDRKIKESEQTDPTDGQLNELKRKIKERQKMGKGKTMEDLHIMDIVDKHEQRKNVIREESKKLGEE